MEADFRRGVELLNAERYYDAHEALEDAWRVAPLDCKRFYQGMVQIAVAMHHYSRGNLNGARSVLDRAVRNVGEWPQGFGGLDLDHLRAQLAAWSICTQTGSSAPPWPRVEWISAPNNADPE